MKLEFIQYIVLLFSVMTSQSIVVIHTLDYMKLIITLKTLVH